MPKVADFRLAWSGNDQTYHLQQTRDQARLAIMPESPAWFSWLDLVSSFAFWGKRGHYTARKERRPRGEAYWYAYVGVGKKLTKKYLGKTSDMTLARLEQVAAALAGQTPQEDPSQATAYEPGADPLQTLDVHLNTLPVQPTPFIGRAQEVAAVAALLNREQVRLLTLTGPGGTGKTRLGLQVAADLSDRFADGVFFVNLAPIRDPAFVLPAIAQALDLKEASEQSPLDLLQAFLREKQVLLLLDNFEQIVQAASHVAALLAACPKLKIMVTSRMVLHVRAEQEFAVPPLSLPDPTRLPDLLALSQSEAVTLFVERAQAIKADFALTEGNARAIAEICRRLDGLPLAIELAAARIKLLPAGALLAQLQHRLAVLVGGPRDLPARQQTLRNTLQWSYDLLTPDGQRLFRRLAVFAGGWQLVAAEAVCTVPGDVTMSVLDGLASLLDNHLLSQVEHDGEEPRFVMLETMREYGLEMLAATGELRISQEAHAHFFLRLSEQAEPALQGSHQTVWAQRLEQEHDNLRAALTWVFEEARGGDPHVKATLRERALRLVGALWSFWYIHCHYREGRQWLQAALVLMAENRTFPDATSSGGGDALHYAYNQEPVQTLSPSLRAKILTGAGVFEQLYHLDGALSLHEESLKASREAGDSLGVIIALTDLAWVALRQGNYEQAERFGQQSLALGRALAEAHSLAASLLILGAVALQQHQYEQAHPFLEECLRLRRILDDKGGCAHALHLLGYLAVLQEEYARVIPLITESMRLRREEGNTQGILMNVGVLAELAIAEMQPHRAVRLLAVVHHRLHEATGLRESDLPVFVQERFKLLQMTARAQLGEATFREMWAEGQEMELEQVLTDALEADVQAGEPGHLEQEQVSTHKPLLSVPLSAASAVAPSHFPDGLTTREVEVLRLLAQGLTDMQIAVQLVISPRTVNNHLTSIYSKIQVSSRAAATRYAMEHRLV